MRESQKGEIITMITIGAFVFVTAIALVSSLFGNHPQTTKTLANGESCGNNPAGAPNPNSSVYDWIADCNSSRFLRSDIRAQRSYCTATSECLRNEGQPGFVDPASSAWCYQFGAGQSDFRCMQLTYRTPPTNTPVPNQPTNTPVPGAPSPTPDSRIGTSCTEDYSDHGQSCHKMGGTWQRESDGVVRCSWGAGSCCGPQGTDCRQHPPAATATPTTHQTPPPNTSPEPPATSPEPGQPTCNVNDCVLCVQTRGCAWSGTVSGGSCVSDHPQCPNGTEWHYWSCNTRDSRDVAACTGGTHSCAQPDKPTCESNSFWHHCTQDSAGCWVASPQGQGSCAQPDKPTCESNSFWHTCKQENGCWVPAAPTPTPTLGLVDHSRHDGRIVIHLNNLVYPRLADVTLLNRHIRAELKRDTFTLHSNCTHSGTDGSFWQYQPINFTNNTVTFTNLAYFENSYPDNPCPHHYWLELIYYGGDGYVGNYINALRAFYNVDHKFTIPVLNSQSNLATEATVNDTIDISNYIHRVIVQLNNHSGGQVTVTELKVYDRQYDYTWVNQKDIIPSPLILRSNQNPEIVEKWIYDWRDAPEMVKARALIELPGSDPGHFSQTFRPVNNGDGALTFIVNFQ